MGSDGRDDEATLGPDATRGEPVDGPVVGRYVVVGLLGLGGMGAVYRAWDPELDRFVALKVLLPAVHGTITGSDPGQRLLREAQLMARLSHPNVLEVHDVGAHGDRVFIALELVVGRTLKAWLKEKKRSWREVLRVFEQAGRGLAAAHDIGLVHRDFKPANVLIGADGGVYVADFGLARLVGSDAPNPSMSTSDSLLEQSAIELSRLTRDGIVVGTPAYMPPEQHVGGVVDERSDQYAFCVALFEGLYGHRPFGGKDVDDLVSNLMRGKMREGKDFRVPRWLRRAMSRGLARDPAERHPSMHALLDALQRGRLRARNQWIASALVVPLAVASLGGWLFANTAEERLCGDSGAALAEAWGGARRSGVVAQAATLGRAKLAGPLLAQMDGFARDWQDRSRDACRAGRVTNERSRQWLTTVERCLDRQRVRFEHFVERVESGDPATLEAAALAMPAVLGVRHCDRLEPRERAGGSRVEEVTAQLDELAVDAALGKDVLGDLEKLEDGAHRLGDAGTDAEVALLLGEQQAARGVEMARRTLRRAIGRADAAREDEIGARAWIALQKMGDPAPFDEGMSRDAVRRAGDPRELVLLLALAEAEGGELNAGRQLLRAPSPEEFDSHVGPLLRAAAELLLARSLAAGGHGEEATSAAVQALALADATLGANHPALAPYLEMLVETMRHAGHVAEATTYETRLESLVKGGS